MNTLNINVTEVIQSNDTNYVIGLLSALISARILHQKENSRFHLDNIKKINKMLYNIIFLLSIVYISTYNYILSGILTIILITINV